MSPESRRAMLVDAARRVFARHGYHRTGVGDIVEAVGVARGTFYRYFDSKRAVFDAVVAAMMDEVVGVVRPIDVTVPVADQVYANLDRLIRAIADEGVCRVLFTEAVGIDASGDAVLRDFYGDVLGRIELALRTGQSLGLVRNHVDVSVTARLLLGMIKEPVVQAALHGDAVDADALVATLVAMLRDGVLRDPTQKG